MKIFLLAGKAGSGKDLLGSYMKTKYDFLGESACIMHITTPLYEYAKNYFSWDGNMQEKPREFLQEMGIEVIKKQLGKKTFLVDRLCEDIDILKHYFSVFIITDGRLISEFLELKKRYPFMKIIHVKRVGYDNNLSTKEKNHVTELEVDKYDDYDYVIENTSKEHLYEEADRIIALESEEELI
ncbi:MAG TPA: hypothetical protein IAB45_03130 [Candidatus Onthousia faecavium]|nr:hypothetical protein [Candidatus Onthousia faecavium]